VESIFGTSAGTRLGPLLFIAYVHDVPKSIFPKFADDLVSVSVNDDFTKVGVDLQKAADDLVEWAERWGMVLNVEKTKVILFGMIGGQSVSVRINNCLLDVVTGMKYLGVFLDPQLDFQAQVECVVGKAKRAFSKITGLLQGRKGINLQFGIGLYKSLVRPHLYVVPVWAAVERKNMVEWSKCNTNALKVSSVPKCVRHLLP